ncbi:snoal-like polyketide cyclase family 2 [Fusarium phyllophilum]|uniref:Snoal-like polyketide cyclase family 2 n=1 Tax=Fusarium phyllophilum TaxID=47803 RepID=A0A8H5MNE7_9HYPO|nr:snoal-like polyketide cyclase family 2 [Fusarium phyllophilum]
MSNPTVTAEVEKIWKEQLTDQPKQTPDQIRAAKALIELFLATFKYHDYSVTRRLVRKDYIQHNLTVGTGQDSIIEFAEREALRETPAIINYKRLLVDGEYVFVQFHVDLSDGSPGLNCMEILRFNDGQFTEHWDVAATIPPASEHKNKNGPF